MKLTENFSLHEFKCKDKKNTPVPKEYMDNVKELAKNLQVLRDEIGDRIIINSGYRTPEYNKAIGGKKASKHMLAQAADVTTKNYKPRHLAVIVERLIAQKKMKQGGIGIYPGFLHYDIRGTKARW